MFLGEYPSTHPDIHRIVGPAAWDGILPAENTTPGSLFWLKNKTLTELSDINQHLSQTSYSQLKVPKLFPRISAVLGPTFMNKHN